MSIRLRLTLGYAAAVAAVLVAVGLLVWYQLGHDLRASLDDALQVQASDVSAGYDTDESVSLAVRDPGRPGIATAMYNSTGGLLRATPGAPALATTPPVGASEAVVNGQRYALYAVSGRSGVTIVAASSLADIQRARDTLGTLLLVVGLGSGVIALVGAWWLAGLALAPMATMGRQLAAIGVADLGKRVSQAELADEVGRLARAVNSMLRRIDEGVRRQSAFVAAASHDLRTPIAALRTELELARAGPAEPAALLAAIDAAHSDAVRLSGLANDLLALAEAEPGGRQLLRQPVSARQLLESCVADQAPLADRQAVNILATAPDATVSVDRSRIEQAVRNLIANAIRFGPRGTTVEVTADVQQTRHGASEQRTFEVTVADRGPGVADKVRNSLFLPFAARGGEEHSGLGLAVAAAAVRAHGGTIEYRDRPGGGALFTFSVPA
jgi:two-component system OmpR family sensor kinase